MNLEWVILAVTIFLVANVYYEGKLLDTLKGWKKYYQIGGLVVVGIGLYLFIKKNPPKRAVAKASCASVESSVSTIILNLYIIIYLYNI